MLEYAVIHDRIATVRFLKSKQEEDMDRKYGTLLKLACSYGSYNCALLFLNFESIFSKGKTDYAYLCHAIRNKRYKFVSDIMPVIDETQATETIQYYIDEYMEDEEVDEFN